MLVKKDKIAKGYDVFQVNNDEKDWQIREMGQDYDALKNQAILEESKIFNKIVLKQNQVKN